ncbi:MAG: hypothetical protein WA941_23810 [Nitrososphaeraceae archaeon]|jgi:hypothetical protein
MVSLRYRCKYHLMNKSNNTVRDAQVNVQFFDDNGNLITFTFGKSIISNPGTDKNSTFSTFSVRSDRGDDTVISHSTFIYTKVRWMIFVYH